MINNTFNAANFSQHAHPQQHAANALLQNTPQAINYMQQLPQLQYPQPAQSSHQLAQFTGQQNLHPSSAQQQIVGAIPQQQFNNENLLEKTYFNASGRPNTILITNNFTQQTQQTRSDGLHGNYGHNLRILSGQHALPQNLYGINNNNNNITNNIPKVMQDQLNAISQQQQQLYSRQLLQQAAPQNFFLQHSPPTQQQHAANELLPTTTAAPSFVPQQFGTHNGSPQQRQQQLELSSSTMTPPQFYMSTEPHVASPSKSVSTSLSQEESSTAVPPSITTTMPGNRSTVVLDRINICINNHYTDSTNNAIGGAGICSPTSALATGPAQQPSPIIPAIQHKPIIDTMGGLLIDPYASNESNVLVIDEPDSTTTTPHTPPTTPDTNVACVTALAAATVQSPSTTSTTGTLSDMHAFELGGEVSTNGIPAPPSTAISDHELVPAATSSTIKISSLCSDLNPLQVDTSNETIAVIKQDSNANLPPTPPTPSPPPPRTPTPIMPPAPAFSEGEDVFIKRQDGRFYLGTVIDHARQQFLVRFDDKSEIWCSIDEMKKLGGGCSGKAAGSDGDSATKADGMCVACKRVQLSDIIEKCERCGRGYHRNCTTETTPGSGEWMCKRCAKPMKVSDICMISSEKASVCRQLPYHVDTLNWDNKHRVNEEQIYCYCGRTGKFNQNMLQCCKCSNWFHTHCMQQFKAQILRGDGFFVFCCSVCNEGIEYLRRLQMNWVDLLHLTLYNLSAMKKHQHNKYHHLLKDIYPFILERRHTLPICREWMNMPESKLLDHVRETLNENTERFICGREIKRDYFYYALRVNGPPILPKVNIKKDDVLSDEFLTKELKLQLLNHTPENSFPTYMDLKLRSTNTTSESSKDDVYEFRIDDDEIDNTDITPEDYDDDIATSSDDEIPIQQILEKAKRKKAQLETENKVSICSSSNNSSTTTTSTKLDINDENANDATITDLQINENETSLSVPGVHQTTQTQTNDCKLDDVSLTPSTTVTNLPKVERSSRKRKAFTLSKPYKQRAVETAARPFDVARLCDTSSDENSSSSRGTSLDVIIPPPKNFLGSNNPFSMLTPKKGMNGYGSNGGGGSTAGGAGNISGSVIKSSIFNTTALDFSSKLAALKSAGIFPNLSTSNLAKAAGQPRTVRTIKRRLSAKDITIGPNQEIRRRRIKRSSANVEVISTTTINPIPSNFFALYAKDLKQTITTMTATSTATKLQQSTAMFNTSSSISPITSEQSSLTLTSTTTKQTTNTNTNNNNKKPQHGRRLRERPSQKSSPSSSRRNSLSSTSAAQPMVAASTAAAGGRETTTTLMQDFKQSVNEYFGVVNRIESGEQYTIRAKRQLPNGQTQYLLEWMDASTTWCKPTT